MNKHFKRLAGAMMAATIVGSAAVLSQDIMPINIMSVSAASETNIVIDGVHYDFYTDALTATIVGIDDSITSFTTPETVTYNGITYKVNSIGNYICNQRTNLKNLTIGSNIEYIAGNAFWNCNSLETVTINGDSDIQSYAFCACRNLEEVTFNGNIEEIADYTFSNCGKLKTIKLPSDLKSIGEAAFLRCSSLTSISLPDSVQVISNSAFDSCSSMTSIELSSNLEYIGDYAFYSCNSLTSISLPDSVQTISKSAFRDCISITSIELSSNLKTIGEGAFCNCSSLISVVIPDSVQTISQSAFSSCTSMTSIELSANLESIEDHTFFSCSALASVSIPDSVQTISQSAFSDCTSMTSIELPANLKFIGASAFSSCTSLKSISIPDSVQTVSEFMFWNCTSMTSVKLPSNLESIDAYAFSNCTSMTSIELPANLKFIGSSAFSGCTSLTYVKLPSNLTKIESGTFNECTSLEMLTLPEKLEIIENSAFYNTTSMTGALVIPEHVTSIGENCFEGSEISELILTGNEDIKKNAFKSCENLSNLVVPLSAKNNWNGSAFEDCKNLKYINDEKVRYSYDDVIKDAVFTNSEDMDKFIRTHFNASTGVGFIESYVDYYCDEVIKRYITPDMTDTQKAMALHDWIIKKVDYDHDYEETDKISRKNHCECSVFINDTTVCEGYARGSAKIMNRAGIETEYFANFDHAWNKCKFGDIYLNVDTCWDDCGDEAYYKWFLISDREVLERETSSHYAVDVIEPHAEYPMGDLNMDKVVDVADYRILQKNLSKNELDKNQLILADINFDGKLDNMDLRGIKEKCMSRYDLNGDRKLNNSDHALLQFAIVKQLELFPNETYKFDINNDGVLDWKDAKDMRDFLEKYCNQDKNAYYRMGDLKLDGTVDREDYNALQDYIKNKTKFKADYYLADIANDHLFIDIFDLGILDELTKYEIGDVNFDNHIDVNDKNLIMEHIAGNTELSDAALWYADINGDGAIDNKDVAELVRILG